MARLMSETEQRRRQKLQSQIGRTTSTLGLAGAGVAATGAIAAKKPGMLKNIPKLKNASPEKLKDAAFYTGIAAGGIGGVGGFNQASIYSAESRRRKQAVAVKKNLGLEMGYYGEEGHPLTHEEIEAEIEKAWTPSASNFDSEGGRKKRSDTYSAGALVTGGAGAAYTGHHGAKAIGHARKIKTEHMAPTHTVPGKAAVPGTPGTPYQRAKKGTAAKTVKGVHVPGTPGTPAVKATKATPGKPATGARMAADVKGAGQAVRTDHLAPALKHGGKAALGAVALGGAIGAGLHIKRKKSSDWQPYSKRDSVSAFGVDHNDEVSKVNVKPFMGNLAPMGALEHTGLVGAGSKTSAKALGAAQRAGSARKPSGKQFQLAGKQAKDSGRRAARGLAQGQSPHSTTWNGPQASANVGWQQKANAWAALPKSGAKPAGMRGPIKSRVKTAAMREQDKPFI